MTDPSNASFMGLYNTVDQSGWNEELCDAAGASPAQLPEVKQADAIGGYLTREAATSFGLTQGVPVTVGMVDTSSAMLLAGTRPGQLLNVCGSTDVLALCTDKPRPARATADAGARGRGRGGDRVSTMAPAGSSLVWAKENLFPDLDRAEFRTLVGKLAQRPRWSRP